MEKTDKIDRQRFWQNHFAAWQASNLTQKAYCHAHNLRYASFGYWVRKLRERSQEHSRQGSGFVPVTLLPTRDGAGATQRRGYPGHRAGEPAAGA